MDAVGRIVARPTFHVLLTRMSIWFTRSPYSAAGGSRSSNTVPLHVVAVPHDPRFRPRDGRISALEVVCCAEICAPGLLWKIRAVWMPHQGSGYTAWSFRFGCNGGWTSQKDVVRGDVAVNDRLR